MNDFVNGCLNHMSSNNLPLTGALYADGKIHRYSASGRGTDRDEWYIAQEGITHRGNAFLVCTYGSWSEGVKYTYKSFDETIVLDEVDRMALRKLLRDGREKAEVLLKEQYEEVADEAFGIWRNAMLEPPSREYDIYTRMKQVAPYYLRWADYHGNPAVIIPLFDINYDLRSLQFIWHDADLDVFHKRFLTGGQKKGNFYMLGTPQDGIPLLVAEGYATGASIYKVSKWATVIAFDAGNLAPVIENLKIKYPSCQIIIAADNDDTGKKKAYEAQDQFECRVAVPTFINGNDDLTDFNDLYVWEGAEEVRKQLARSLGNRGLRRDFLV